MSDFDQEESWIHNIFECVREEMNDVVDHFYAPIFVRVKSGHFADITKHPGIETMTKGLFTELFNMFSATVMWTDTEDETDNE